MTVDLGEDPARRFAAERDPTTPPLVARGPDAADEVVGERAVELRGFVDDPDPEIGVVVVGQLGARYPSDALALGFVAEVDESGEPVLEADVGRQGAPFLRGGRVGSCVAARPRTA